MTTSRIVFWLLLLFLLPWLVSCGSVRDARFRQHYHSHNDLLDREGTPHERAYLKVHLHNGDVMIFDDSWQFDSLQLQISGTATHYDFNRRIQKAGELVIPLDSVILFETNRLPENRSSERLIAMSIIGAADMVLGAICLSVPKACFGSCPTFYLNKDSHPHYADAESFSNAIAPALEYTDVDALNNPPQPGGLFSLYMKNEAIETHNLRSVQLMAYPRSAGKRIYHTADDRFFEASLMHPPARAMGQEGDIRWLVSKADQQERFSLADSLRLDSKESIELVFEPSEAEGQPGLAIGFRQSLMTTYLLYHALSSMGNRVSDYMAGIRPSDEQHQGLAFGLWEALGGIDVFLWDEVLNDWIFQGSWYETGPIAINHQMMPLKTAAAGKPLRIRLDMNKGLWRIDYLGLVENLREVKPLEIQAHSLMHGNTEAPARLDQLNDEDQYLVSLPGDVYRMDFMLPADHDDYELFIQARGHYLIWNRPSWTRERELLSLYRMARRPGGFLRRHAAPYKEYEKLMEEAFWNSRVIQQIISGHEQ